MNRSEFLGRFILLILAFAFCCIRFTDFFSHPNQVIEPYGDGFKAYTVIAYHGKYDTSLHHFGGMHYPYGDHALSSATQPIISNSIHLLNDLTGIDLTDKTIAIVNWSMLLSLMLGSFFLYLIFRRYKLPIWLAIMAALGIVMLSPQIHRMHAHYGLSHIMVLPGLLYGLMRYEEKPDWKISIGLGLWITICSLIHFYYFAIQVFTVSLFFLIRIIQRQDWKAILYYALHYGLQVIVPLTFFLYWIYGNETVQDRTGQPWGFFHFHSFLTGLTTSPHQPHWAWVDQNVMNLDAVTINNFEGRTYLGLTTLLLVPFVVGSMIRKRTFQPFFQLQEGKLFVTNLVITGLILIIFSFGIPFVWSGWEKYLDAMGPLRQFRSMGRFAWTGYYVLNLAAWIWLHDRLRNLPQRYFLWVLALLLLGFEGVNQAWGVNLKLDAVTRFEEGNRFTDINGIDYNDYQAILTVPYYNIGSDQFWWEGEGFILQNSLTLSLQTGLPVTSAMLTRTSRRHTLNQLQLVTEPYRMPRILEDFNDERPLLMMVDEREYLKEKNKYAHLLDHARLLYLEGDRLRLYTLPLQAFAKNISKQQARVSVALQDTTLFNLDNGMLSDTVVSVIHQPFSDTDSSAGYQGEGGLVHVMHPDSIVTKVRLPAKAGTDWIFRGWFFIDQDRRTRAEIRFEELDSDGQSLQVVGAPIRKTIRVFDPNGWALGEQWLRPKADSSTWEIKIIGEHMSRQTILVDEWLWAPADVDLYRNNDEYTWWNNRFYPR